MKATEQANQIVVSELAVISDEEQALQGWTIATESDLDFAGEHLRDVKSRMKQLDTERKKITDPLHAAKKAVDTLFRKPRLKLEAIERQLKSGIADYLERQALATAEALQAAAETADPVEAAEAISRMTPAAVPQGVSVRQRWRAVVVEASQVPAEFLTPDLDKIQAFCDLTAKELGQPKSIPGVDYVRDDVVSVRVN